MTLHKAFTQRKAIFSYTSTLCNSYCVLHPLASKAISGNSTNFEANMATEWTDRQTICQFWLGLTSGVIEEDRASEVCHAISTHTAWRNSKLSHPGGQKHSGCKAPSARTHTHTHRATHIHTLFACWLWILQISVWSSSDGQVIGR